MSGNSPASLGLHPAIYFYGATGRYQPAAFLAAVRFIQNLEQRRAFIRFTDIRAKFEDFLLKYRYFTKGYGQELCLENSQAAGFSLIPSMKTVPLMTSASSSEPFNDRQLFDADSISL